LNNYVVIASQYRGTDGGEGQEEFGGMDINDVLNLIPLAKSLSFTDSSKIVMLGYSGGGMMSYIAIKNKIGIKAGAIVGGVTDLIQLYNERGPDMKNVLIELIGGTPTTKENEYKNRSAVYWPEKLNLPILILHGENDWKVNVTQVQKLAVQLNQLGYTHKLIVYPNGDHGLSTHSILRDREILNWFSKYQNEKLD